MTARHGPPSRKRREAWQARLHREREQRMARFADLLSDNMSITQAARVLGLSQQTGSAMFRDMCARLGVPSRAKDDLV